MKAEIKPTTHPCFCKWCRKRIEKGKKRLLIFDNNPSAFNYSLCFNCGLKHLHALIAEIRQALIFLEDRKKR